MPDHGQLPVGCPSQSLSLATGDPKLCVFLVTKVPWLRILLHVSIDPDINIRRPQLLDASIKLGPCRLTLHHRLNSHLTGKWTHQIQGNKTPI